MKEMGATVSQANKSNHPDITVAPDLRNSHEPSLLAQEKSCLFAAVLLKLVNLASKTKVAFFIDIHWNYILRAKLTL
jgi:hypothetical protein